MDDNISTDAVLGRSESRSSTAPGSIGEQSVTRQHSSELDTLRAVAIFSVLFSHYLPSDNILNVVQRGVLQGPAFGVPLFFTLSGFLITRILTQSRDQIDRGTTTARHSLYIFYARRFLRIFPLYYAVLFLGVILKYSNVKNALPWHLAYLSNVYYMHRGAFDKGPAPVFWTLSVEEQFYLVWPLLFLLVPTRWLPKITLAIAFAGVVFAAWASTHSETFNILTPSYLSYLALGGYLGLIGLAPFGSAWKLQRVMALFIVAMPFCASIGVISFFTVANQHLRTEIQNASRYACASLAFSWIVAYLSQGVTGPIGNLLRWRPLTFAGKISYGIYILQFFVTQMIDKAVPKVAAHIGNNRAAWLLQSFPIRVAAIIAVASLSWFLFEKPLNELKRYFPYSSKNDRSRLA
jgi:peptidoglycan/LPS O-acetylase OafA/YrhL